MRDGQTLVFVEVRHRGHGSFADGIDSVDIFKQRKLAAAAQHYLAKQVPGQADACRFDVVSLGQRIEWVQDAFTLDQIY